MDIDNRQVFYRTGAEKMFINETVKAIMRRRSVRSYKPDPIPKEILKTILEAGQAAPYVEPDSRHFCVIRDKNRVARLSASAKSEGMKLSDAHREMFSAPGMDFRDEVQYQIKDLPKEKIVHLAWLWAVRALPMLGVEGNLDYWGKEKRLIHLYSVLNAIDGTWSALKKTAIT